MLVEGESTDCSFFFFQAEDGIRDVAVTGVQTCALPISVASASTTDTRLDSAPLPAPTTHAKCKQALAYTRACAVVLLVIGLMYASRRDRKSTRLNSSHGYISYAVFCLKKKITHRSRQNT